MKKIMKWLGIVVGMIILISIVGMITLMAVVNPNRFKPLIVQQVEKQTGRLFTIDGNVSWSFFPYFGVTVGRMVLNNPPGFSDAPFAEIKSAGISIQFIPLFQSHVQVNTIMLDGLTLHLIKNADGKMNWDLKRTNTRQPLPKTSQIVVKPEHQTKMTFAISAVDLTDATIHFDNKQTHQVVKIEQLNCHAKDIGLNQFFPVAIDFNFMHQDPAVSGKITLKSELQFNSDKEILTLKDLAISGLMKQAGEQIEPVIHLNVIIDSLHQTTIARGVMRISALRLTKFKADNVVIPIHFEDGIIDLNPVTANLYQGQLQANTKIDINKKEMPLQLQATLSHIQAEPLLQDLKGNQKIKISGSGDINLQITTRGTSAETILKNLNGSAKLRFSHGTLKGIDIGHYLEVAYQLAKRQSIASVNHDETAFGDLTATAVIRNGVVNNQDLFLDSPRFETKGKGDIDLIHQQLNYRLENSVKQSVGEKEDWQNLYGIAIPVLIKGNLANPEIRLDTGAIMRAVAMRELKNTKDQVIEKIKEKIPSEAVDALQHLLGN